MGEAKRRADATGGMYGALAPRLFINAWFKASTDQQIELTDQQMISGDWVVMAKIGNFTALLTPVQTRGVADEFEAQLGKEEAQLFIGPISDLIVALRAAADEVERLHPAA